MLPYEDLKALAGCPETRSVLARSLPGATAEIAAPRGIITHAILDAADFPLVLMAVEGEGRLAQRRNFFSLPTDIYEDSEWSFTDLDEEALIAEAIQKYANIETHDHRSRPSSQSFAPPPSPTNPVRQADAEEWLNIYRGRLQTALRIPAARRQWAWMVKDISKLQGFLAHPKDRGFIGGLGFVWSSNAFSPSPAQAKWLEDIPRKILAATNPHTK